MGAYISHTKGNQMKIHYLYSLAVVHFHHMEVKTVYPFAWRNEITSFLIKIPPDVDQNLKERKREGKEGKNVDKDALLSLSVVALKSLFTELMAA